MAVASSISTYLDVTQAAGESPAQFAVPVPDTAVLEQAAKVLAAIDAGTELVTDLPERTGLDTTQVLALLSRLADASMIEIDQDQAGGAFRVRLTESTQAALSSA